MPCASAASPTARASAEPMNSAATATTWDARNAIMEASFERIDFRSRLRRYALGAIHAKMTKTARRADGPLWPTLARRLQPSSTFTLRTERAQSKARHGALLGQWSSACGARLEWRRVPRAPEIGSIPGRRLRPTRSAACGRCGAGNVKKACPCTVTCIGRSAASTRSSPRSTPGGSPVHARPRRERRRLAAPPPRRGRRSRSRSCPSRT